MSSGRVDGVDGPATVSSLHGGGVSRTRRRAATRLDSPRRTVRDHAHATAALPQATTTAGARSAHVMRWRRSRPPASSSGSGTRARPSSGSTPSLRRPRLLPSWLTTTTTTPTPWRRARRASPTSARARSARCARGGRRRLAPFPTSPRIPGRRPVSTRRLVVFPRRRSCYRTIPGPRPRADPAGGRGFCLTP